MPSASDLDAVTVDALGTVLELVDPTAKLRQALMERGVERDHDEVAAAFGAEVAYYLENVLGGRDDASLGRLRRECAAVFLRAARADVDVDEFVPTFVGALAFRPLEGAEAALASLGAAGLELACVSDWDVGIHEHLRWARVGRFFAAVVSSAEVGARKPDPAVFREALRRLDVTAERALHVGDGDGDRDGAAAAGLAFEPTPLATLPDRLGVR